MRQAFLLPLLVLLYIGVASSAVSVSSAHAAPIAGVGTGTAAFVGMSAQGPFDTPTLVTSYGAFAGSFGTSTVGLSNPWLAPSVAAFFANGGQRLYVVRVAADDDASLIGVDLGPGSRTGLQSLLETDEISTVAIPGSSSQIAQTAMIAHCESTGDRMAILDPDAGANVAGVLAQRAGLASDDGYAALYFPWVVAAPAGVSMALPPSGFVAGIYASTDPPDSPVDFISTATSVSYTVSNADQELLNPQGINAIRFFSGQGVRVWGARTLASSQEWIYVSVRRQALFLEESIDEGTQWAVFEPNDAPLWAQLRSDVDAFLFSLFQSGWFQGASSSEAYFSQCGLGTTMTQIDIDEGRTIILVGFAAIRPAEFQLVRVEQQRNPVTATGPVARSRLTLHPAAPNPFNPSTTIRFELASPQSVELQVFDLAGRRVRSLLAQRTYSAGEHRVQWDGRNDAGRVLASGSYVVRLVSSEEDRTQRVTLLK